MPQNSSCYEKGNKFWGKGFTEKLHWYSHSCVIDQLQELALLHRSRRTATVVSQDAVQLLTIGRDDFFDIFMSGQGPGQIPDHVGFVRFGNNGSKLVCKNLCTFPVLWTS